MPTEIGMWRVDGARAERMHPMAMPTEQQLEDMIEQDPDILGIRLLIIGRQVTTPHGGRIDLLATDGDGVLHLLELKKARTPRDVLAQALDYGSWVRTLSHTEILQIYGDHDRTRSFERAFEERFGAPAPEVLNTAHRLTIVASELDAASERILTYLNDLGVPANAVFFQYFGDGDRRYLARTWLLDEAQSAPATSGRATTREPWNGRDWYVSFGEGASRVWEDAVKYGFVSAGGDGWYSRTLRGLPSGARVFVHIPKAGYVGVGEVVRPAEPFAAAIVATPDGERPLSQLALAGSYRHDDDTDDPDKAEYVVAVKWLKTVPRTEAVWRPGFFANQNSACRLRNRATLDVLHREFDLESE